MFEICLKFRRRMENHGIGLHTNEEINEVGYEDLRAVSNYLGVKRYLFGDQPTRVRFQLNLYLHAP